MVADVATPRLSLGVFYAHQDFLAALPVQAVRSLPGMKW